MEPAVFRLEALFEEYEHVPDMLVLGSSDGRTRTIGELLALTGETISPDLRLGYTEPRGEARLRDAIARIHGRRREEVLVTVGANEAIFLLAHTLLSPRDRALIGTPAYQSIPEMIRHAGAELETYEYPEENAFRPDAQAMAERIAAASPPFTLVVLNSPHNPTGRVLDSAALQIILDTARRRGTRVVVDEVMSGIFAAGTERVPSVTFFDPDAIAIGNASKSLGLGGLRVGWIVAPADVIHCCTRWRYYTSISPPVLVQQLAAIAAEHRPAIVAENEQIVRRNEATLRAWAESRDALEILPWEGGTVVLARLTSGEPDEAFSRRVAAEARVFVVPCSTFDLPGYLRIGLGLPSETFARALERLAPCL